jgi:hypothetical protein
MHEPESTIVPTVVTLLGNLDGQKHNLMAALLKFNPKVNIM